MIAMRPEVESIVHQQQAVLPKVEMVDYQPEPEGEGITLEFRLCYRGPLPSETSHPRVGHKNRIRKVFHSQLVEYWEHSPYLKSHVLTARNEYCNLFKTVSGNNHIWRFVPLIGKENSTSCSLDILFLRRDFPGGVVRHGGDIDNRLKVLFDALKRPSEPGDLEDRAPGPDEDPLFCLLEDDRYIDRFTVITDRLLTPQESDEKEHDVVLVIHVKTTVFSPAYNSFWCAY